MLSQNRTDHEGMPFPARSFLLPFFFAARVTFAQSDSTNARLLQSGLEQLLEKEPAYRTTPASQQTRLTDLVDEDVRQAPGMVQVLTAQEINAAGCRTLEDALMLLPSFTIGRDVDDVLGVAVRGQWAHEGKCLFMLNGMPLNEASYGIYALGSRMSLQNVIRIEVINGPGSVLYGGFAALAVVNIVTKSLQDEESLQVSSTVSATRDGLNIHTMDLSGQHHAGPDTELDFQMGMISGKRYAAKGLLLDGAPISYQDSARSEDVNGYVRIMHRGFTGQFLYNDHMTRVSDQRYDVLMRTLMANGTRRFDLGGKAHLDLMALYRNQQPWSYSGLVEPGYFNTNTIDQRYALNSTVFIDHAKWVQSTWGMNGYFDRYAHIASSPEAVFAFNGERVTDVLDLAAFGQVRTKAAWGSLLAGIRAEQHTLGGFLATPRFAYTALLGKAHVKVLYSRAFKMPTLQNVNSGPADGGMRPEEVITQEAEVGYRFFDALDVAVRVYHTAIENPIIYVVQQVESEFDQPDSYVNRPSIGSEGIEARVQCTRSKAGATAYFSAYRTDRHLADLPEVQLPAQLSSGHLGIPQTKASLVAWWYPATGTRISGNVIWSGSTWIRRPSEDGETLPSYQNVPAYLRSGVQLSYEPHIIKGLSLALGVDDILDQGWSAHSPYDNGLTSLPMAGRTFMLHISYRFPL